MFQTIYNLAPNIHMYGVETLRVSSIGRVQVKIKMIQDVISCLNN
jgi:hypothetical protein